MHFNLFQTNFSFLSIHFLYSKIIHSQEILNIVE